MENKIPMETALEYVILTLLLKKTIFVFSSHKK